MVAESLATHSCSLQARFVSICMVRDEEAAACGYTYRQVIQSLRYPERSRFAEMLKGYAGGPGTSLSNLSLKSVPCRYSMLIFHQARALTIGVARSSSQAQSFQLANHKLIERAHGDDGRRTASISLLHSGFTPYPYQPEDPDEGGQDRVDRVDKKADVEPMNPPRRSNFHPSQKYSTRRSLFLS
jgi:hypothetical protein